MATEAPGPGTSHLSQNEQCQFLNIQSLFFILNSKWVNRILFELYRYPLHLFSLRLSVRKSDLQLDFTAQLASEKKLRMDMCLPNVVKASWWTLTTNTDPNRTSIWSTCSSEPKSTHYLTMILKSLQMTNYEGASRCRILLQHFYSCCFRLLLKNRLSNPQYSMCTWKHVAAWYNSFL